MKKILACSVDPGGTNCLIPVVNRISQSEKHNILLLGKKKAVNTYKSLGLAGQNLESLLGKDCLYNDILEYVKSERPDVIFTSTSAVDFTERYLWKAAHECGTPSAAVLDLWTSYLVRFSEDTPRSFNYNELKISYLPDVIMVMDDVAKKEMVALGFPQERICITGQPHLEESIKKLKFSAADKRDFLRKHNVRSDATLITLAPSAVSYSHGADRAKEYFGFNDMTIAEHVVDSLERAYNGKPIHLIIKQHPVDNESNRYDCFIRNDKCDPIHVSIERYANQHFLISISDLIIGMFSGFLLEAVILNKPVVSVVIGLKGKNPSILERRGLLESIRDKDKLISIMRDFLMGRKFERFDFKLPSNSVDNIIHILEGLQGSI